MIRKKHYKYLFSFLIFFTLAFFAKVAGAQLDIGVDAVNDSINLSSDDPRSIAARVINVAMLFLSVLAVGVVLVGGFKWMTSNGDENRVSEAKKLLKNGVIGLVIILASWGITVFVMNQLLGATGNNGGETCPFGTSCGCGGVWYQGADGSCVCQGSDCSKLPNPPQSCDSNKLTPQCEANNSLCSTGSYCDDSCVCQPKSGLGESCDAEPSLASCQAQESKCSAYLTCDAVSCLCQGAPVITEISPVGGFCEDNYQACQTDSDCTAGVSCNTENPNGTAGNFVSIFGYNFADFGTDSGVSFINLDTNQEVIAQFPNTGDLAICGNNYWQDQQIIVLVPSGLTLGDSYAIKVIRHLDNNSNYSNIDISNDANGPQIPNFIYNNIARPGLCNINPSEEFVQKPLIFTGAGFNSDIEMNFGVYANPIAGLDQKYVSHNQIKGKLPNLVPGNISTFVRQSVDNILQNSNYLRFTVLDDSKYSRYITDFEPLSGPVGTYVTIRGNGFGRIQGQNNVYFVDSGGNKVLADYDFPSVCANSFWSDKQIIVKVPDNLSNGLSYKIEIDLQDQEDYLSSDNLVPPNNLFIFDATKPLSPGLCKIEPIRGQVGTEVSFWGEYFGDNQQKDAKAVFYSQSETNLLTVIAAGTGKDTSQKIVTDVPGSTASGPAVVKNINNNQVSNSLNFSVGACQENDECGAQICCPQGSYKAGTCAGSLGDCSSSSLTSVFQWRFSTVYSDLVVTDNYSCNGWAQALGTCQTGKLCPNAPGQCSPFNPYTNNQPEGNCCESGFSYSKDLKKCLKDGASCDLPFRASPGNPLITCSEFGTNVYHWLVISADYPTLPESGISSWINLGNNRYTDSTNKINSTCTVCSDDYSCVDDGDDDNRGVCAESLLCAGGTTCRADNLNNYKCYPEASCQCCCEVGEEVRDCCQGLVCGGSCGADTDSSFDKISGLGRCSGCKTVGGTQTDWDAACSCSGHSGQYCEISDTDFPTGFCTDCSELSEQNCRNHSSVCCYDEKNNVCRGGDGNLVSSSPGSCAYYACDASDSLVCASSNPLASGPYANIDSCEAGCPQDGGDSYCSKITVVNDCRNESACCWDAKGNKCSGGDGIEIGVDAGYCDYYSCSNCSTAGKDLTFASSDQCFAQCSSGGPGNSCTNAFGDSEECDQFACGASSQCLLKDGTVGGVDVNDCGACCCEVGASGACADLNAKLVAAGDTSVQLTCQADQAPCTGADRGLCCGCSADNQCGNKATVGCDSGTCCRARPVVLTNKTAPAENADKVCRNAMIKVQFNQAMDVTTFTDNILLLEEKEAGSSCPAGTFVAQNEFDSKKSNFLARIWYSVKSFSQRVLGLTIKQDSALADFSPDSNKVYCSIPGLVSNDQGDNYSLIFKPQRLLSANAVHYIIVKGDADLNSASGVMSAWGVGFNGQGLNLSTGDNTEGEALSFNGVNYINSYISAFKTLPSSSANSGICLIDHVSISPSSYLFQTTESDLNEDDSDSTSPSFDTKADNDRVFSAYALSDDNQIITPTANVYNWNWDWSIDDRGVVDFNTDVFGLSEDKKLVFAKPGITDDNTLVKATVNMNSYTSNISSYGNGADEAAPAYVFTCANPWPAVAGNNTWLPWSDNNLCVSSTGTCNDYNYSFYYCRDAGQPGTADDLPAISKNPVQRGGSLICSISGATCSSAGTNCSNGGGVCIFDILKESYFFRAARPSLVSIISLEDKEIGGTVALQWQSQKEVPYNGTNVDVSAYKIYYGLSGGAMTSKLIDAGGGNCSSSGSNYVCNETISGLIDNQTYVFRVTALTADNAESQLSAPASVVPTDKTPPPAPAGFGAGS